MEYLGWGIRRIQSKISYLKSQERFNFPAKKLHKRLLQLGATPILPRGDADDQHPHGFVCAVVPLTIALMEV